MSERMQAARGWAETMLELGEALERLGPIRATLSPVHGLILDGRYGVAPAEVIAAAARVEKGKSRSVPPWLPRALPGARSDGEGGAP